jgi:selenide,water dikinase
VAAAIDSMRTLNRAAAEAITSTGEPPGAVTDVTGFGLLGHAWEVAERSNAVVELDASALPLLPGALEAATAGVRTGGDARNREYLAGRIASSVPEAIEALAYDPQTSGGLLATVTPAMARTLASAGFVPVGRVVSGGPGVRLA